MSPLTYSDRIHFCAAAQQFVGRERRERVSQLTWWGEGCFDSRRRVNSDVGSLLMNSRQTRSTKERSAELSIRNKRNFVFWLIPLLIFSFCEVSVGQKPSERWSRNLPAEQRSAAYEKARFSPVNNDLGAMLESLWITPLVAQSIVSFTLDREKITSEEAEQRYAWLRQDHHLVIISIHGLSYQYIKSQAKIFLLVGNENLVVPAEVVKAPFTIGLLMSEGPRDPAYLVRFPRRIGSGAELIPPATKKVEIVVQFPRGQAVVPISVKKLITAGADL